MMHVDRLKVGSDTMACGCTIQVLQRQYEHMAPPEQQQVRANPSCVIGSREGPALGISSQDHSALVLGESSRTIPVTGSALHSSQPAATPKTSPLLAWAHLGDT